MLKRLVQDAREMSRREPGVATASQPSWGLGAVLLSALLVALAMGYGRGSYPRTWSSRYLTLTQPIGILIYLTHGAAACPRGDPPDARPGDGLCVRLVLADWPSSLAPAHHAQRSGTEKDAPTRHCALECRLEQVLPAP